MRARVNRFDHAVIAVPDLGAAVDTYRGLGFDVSLGGRHTGRGTHNAIIRFGLDYLELLGIDDPAAERELGGELSGFLDRTGGGLVGFALATSDIDAIAADWTSGFAPVGSPELMERMRPDGFRLQWRLLIPGGTPWERPWPFIIQWDTPDSERLARDAPGRHLNGVTQVAGVTVVTTTAQRMFSLYRNDLGLTVERETAHDATFRLGPLRIRCVEGNSDGLHQLELAVTDLNKARDSTAAMPESDGRLVIPPQRTLGVRIALVPTGTTS